MRTRLALIGTGILTAGALIAAYRGDRSPTSVDPKYINSNSCFIDLPQTKIHFRDTGEGPPLLLLHGIGSSLHTWSEWEQYLRDSFRVLHLDLPGFGLSEPYPDNQYSLARYVETLDQFLEQQEVDSVRLAGNSFGGRLALRYGLEHPDKLKKIVLLNPTGLQRKSMLYSYFSPRYIPSLVYRLTPRALVARCLRKLYGDPDRLDPDVVDRYYDLLLRGQNRSNLKRFHGMIDTPDEVLERFLRKLDVPVMIQRGCRDPWIDVDVADRFHRMLPNSSILTYLSAGHLPMEEIPEQTAHDARSFLSSD